MTSDTWIYPISQLGELVMITIDLYYWLGKPPKERAENTFAPLCSMSMNFQESANVWYAT